MAKCPECGENSLEYFSYQKRAICKGCGFISSKLQKPPEYAKEHCQISRPIVCKTRVKKTPCKKPKSHSSTKKKQPLKPLTLALRERNCKRKESCN